MICKEITKLLEQLAPIKYAEKWDNVGLIIGNYDREIKTIMVALDATDSVVQQAIDNNAEMLITHHPMIFSPLKKITTSNFLGNKIIDLIKNDICYYAMHTNLDVKFIADKSAQLLNLYNTKVLELCEDINENEGIGRVGFLKKAMNLQEFAYFVKDKFNVNNVRVFGDNNSIISKVAVCTGSGKSFISNVLRENADIYVTGDIDYHTAIDAMQQGLNIIDAGHFGTEHFIMAYIKEYLENNLNDKTIKIIEALETPDFKVM